MDKAVKHPKVQSITYAAIMAAVMVMLQVVMSGLPNIEPVSLLIVVYTLYDPRLTRWAIAVFVALEGLIFGFNLWWLCYLYVWYLLHLAIHFTRRYRGAVFCALVSAAFGLCFGTLCSIPYFFTGGIGGGLAWIASGIPFDVMHCVANFALALVLYTPLTRLFAVLPRQTQ